MGLAGVCVLRRSAGYILGGAAGQSVAATAAARRRSEGGWASGGVRSFSRAAAAMAPIKVRLLADPTGAFGKETDLLLDDSLVSIFGNRRLKRFSMVVQDGIVKALNVEPDGTGLTCSLAPSIISQL
ncbi:PREDICTED: peroxiredoxin-5, mitochondrial isoform X3 [Mandrillus leucophaeus]|uniref:Peroxiredoxin 5 n=4 Tax=Cercopithecinae TaxID=9528 RepID=A0A2K5MKQ0_CERAT|nr:PREDICTED: peroxiredoxin-5, mitochondrial isoform X3 [Mandrillus leucophaeus]XP_025211397.1 peroxiredoxin-5, mitochondrial isoform X4 [Theropithecus gelada]